MLRSGEVLAGYRVERVIGRGGMGVVYEATQLSLRRTVALKVLAPDLSGDQIFHKRFRREGELQSRIDHPHIVTVYEAGVTEEALFLAMRIIRGPTLKDMIISRELDPARAIRILKQIADAIDTAHESGLVHRDIKPQNILVAGRDHAYLSDFGLTQALGETSITASGAFVGTYDYVSPEQVSGERATPLSDIYSFAGVLYESLTGCVPYPKPSKAAVLFAHVSADPPRVTDQRPELPFGLDRAIARGMAKRPEDRHPTAAALITEADEAFGRRVRAVNRPPGPVETPAEIGVRDHEARVPTDETKRMPEPAQATPAVAGPAATAVTPVGRQPAREDARAPKRRVLLLATVLAGLAAAAAGVLAGAAGHPRAAPGHESVASVGPIEVHFPVSWRVLDHVPAIRGLSLREPLSLSAPGGVAAPRIVTGVAQPAGPGLLPRSLRAALGTAQAVHLGPAEALRYDAVSARSAGGARRIYVVPISSGIATIACIWPATQPLAVCDQVAGSLRLRGARAFPVGPDPIYAAALTTATSRVAAARDRAARTFATAPTAQAQAAVSRALSSAYGSAAQTLTRQAAPPQVASINARITSALTHAARSYSLLASAAAGGRAAAYRAASRAAGTQAAAVDAAVASLRRFGYKVG